MSYCPGLDYDIFISYAHVNNNFQWVDDLEEVLSARLPEEMSQQPAIWRDKGGLDGKRIDEGISKALKNSAVFLAIGSGAFLRSEYCIETELANFGREDLPVTIGEYCRVITVIYEEPGDQPISKWPQRLRESQAVRFATARDGPLPRVKRDPEVPYWKAMEELVRKIMAVLEELKRRGKEPAPMRPIKQASTGEATVTTAYRAQRKPSVHLTYDRAQRIEANSLASKLELLCEVVSLLPSDSPNQMSHLPYSDGHILLYDCEDVDRWANELARESVATGLERGRPRRIGLCTGCAEDFPVRSSHISVIPPGDDGLASFVSALKKDSL